MKACPTRFEHPSEAMQLEGIGPGIVHRLTETLKTRYKNLGIKAPTCAYHPVAL